jgi:hypothetical protein
VQPRARHLSPLPSRRVAALLAALVGGCETRTAPTRPLPSAQAARTRPTPGPGLAAPSEGIARGPGTLDDPGDAGDRLARCIASVDQRTPAPLAGALAALDDRALVEDGCRLALAVEGGQPGWCSRVVYAPVRSACLRRAAIVARDAAACPRAVGARARDPLCVALAARDPRLCAAAGATERVVCTAAALHDPGRCSALDPLLRPGCVREAAVLAPLTPAMVLRHPLPATGGAAFADADADAPWSLGDVARGVWVDDEGWVWVVDAAMGWPAHVVSPEHPLVALRVRLGATPEADDAVEARVELPGRVALDTRDGTLHGRIRWRMEGRRRGNRNAAEVELVGAGLARGLTVRAWWDSFVRDLIPADAMR